MIVSMGLMLAGVSARNLRLESNLRNQKSKSGCASSWLKCNRFKVAEPTGLEPATSDVTGRRSNQLNYDSAFSNLKSQI
jgi:hypothetical protein